MAERLASAVLALALALLAGPASAAEFLQLDISDEDGRYQLLAQIRIAAPREAVYAVLTDFDHLDRLGESIRSSRRLPRPDPADVQVATHLKVCLGPLCRYASQVQQLSLSPHQRIHALAIPERSDFRHSESEWLLEAVGEETLLRYTMSIEPEFWIPPLIGPLLVRRAMRNHGEEMAQQLERLAQAAAGASG